MTLVRFDNVSLDFGNQAILTRASLAIDSGERLCLIGRNGAGKSTTLKLISGRIEPDSGEIVRRSGMITSELAQSLPDADGLSVREAVASGLAGIQALLDEYELLAASGTEPEAMRGLEALHQSIDAHDGWSLDQRVDSILDELSLPAGRKMHELSGGWRRRVALATALVQKPDLLLLDEPTNHLDIVTIEWLESVVRNYRGAVLFITHDRAFLQSLATRILEIDRGRLTSWPGDYRNFLIRKEQFLEDEATEQARFDRKLEQEEIWIRQGIKARRTRNEGRVRALESMRRERAKRVNREGTARIQIEEAERTGRQVIRARNIGYGYGERTVINDFSIRIMRGDRIGILGNNGVGKTTLLKLLLKEVEPQSGTVKHGSNLAISYFDQLRGTLDPEKSVADNVAEGRTHLRLGGSEQHIIGYLKGFLFSPARSMMPVKALSGGEHNRIILAKLFTRPANLLVLDEPTNDLDMETLEVLEDRLAAFDGTLLIVSHDRQFLDNVVTSTVAFEADGGIREYVGGYSDWLRHGKALAEADTFEQRRPARQAAGAEPAARRASKLGYKEQRELERLPQHIEELEAAVRQLQQAMSEEAFYSRPREDIEQLLANLGEQQSALDGAIARWAELEDKQARLRTPG